MCSSLFLYNLFSSYYYKFFPVVSGYNSFLKINWPVKLYVYCTYNSKLRHRHVSWTDYFISCAHTLIPWAVSEPLVLCLLQRALALLTGFCYLFGWSCFLLFFCFCWCKVAMLKMLLFKNFPGDEHGQVNVLTLGVSAR